MGAIRKVRLPRDERGNDANDFREESGYLARATPIVPHTIGQTDGTDYPSDEARGSPQQISVEDFRAHMPDHKYIFTPTRDLWPASSIDSRLPKVRGADGQGMKPSQWLDQNRPVEQMVWAPGESMLIQNRLMHDGGWVNHSGVTSFNLYREPILADGDPNDAGPWLTHIRRIYGDDADHIVHWFAQRVQNPGVKINHALVLGGKQGIGKDTIIEPVRYAVGPWNFQEVAPTAMLGRFNGFVKSVILRISEARDLGEMDRFAFYDHTKVYTAAPPDVLRCDEKNIREHYVMNVCGVIITTNHKSDGIYLPADDRRHFVAWSDLDRSEFDEVYWRKLWQWYQSGGIESVGAYLRELDLSGFDPKAPPPKTEAFWHIVNAARSPEESELADILQQLKQPDVITINMLAERAKLDHPDFAEWLLDRKNRKHVAYRLEDAGYEPVRNTDANDGLWAVGRRRMVVYASRNLTLSDRLKAVRELTA